MTVRLRAAVRRLMTIAAIVSCAVAAGPTAAQSIATHMKIEGLPGDGTLQGHANEIVLLAYSQTFGTRNCSRVVAHKLIDRSSPGLISRAAANTQIPQVIITLTRRPENQDFFRAVLDIVAIERVELGEQTDQLIERVVLAPRSIRIEYQPQLPDGSLGALISTAFSCA
jgi:type VI protein secretion system component Hcp